MEDLGDKNYNDFAIKLVRNLVLIKLNGGLGNQMFQYALGHIIALKNNSQIKLDKELFKLTEKSPGHTPRNYELGIFDILGTTASKQDIGYFEHLSLINKLRRELYLNYPKMCFERNFSFVPDIKTALPPVYLRGYFQSYKYLEGDEEAVREVFRFPEKELDKNNKDLLQRIRGTNSVSVHIRRGDYVKDEITKKFHGNCSRDYYDQAILKIMRFEEEVEFFFFSDDIKWVENEFRDFPIRKTFVASNPGSNSWKDMFLMTNCKHNIIANSSFSWWAAWLNRNSLKKVIAPRQWFNNPEKEQYTYDLIPNEWIRL